MLQNFLRQDVAKLNLIKFCLAFFSLRCTRTLAQFSFKGEKTRALFSVSYLFVLDYLMFGPVRANTLHRTFLKSACWLFCRIRRLYIGPYLFFFRRCDVSAYLKSCQENSKSLVFNVYITFGCSFCRFLAKQFVEILVSESFSRDNEINRCREGTFQNRVNFFTTIREETTIRFLAIGISNFQRV